MTPRWWKLANCIGRDLSLFYPKHDNAAAFAHGREVCLACPVKEECLAHALATNEQHGMWGGASPRERRAISAGAQMLAEWGSYHGDAAGTPRGYYREKRAGQKPCYACARAYNKQVSDREKARRRERASA